MATRQIATAQLVQGPGGVATGNDLLLVMSCTEKGTPNVVKRRGRLQAYLDDKGLSDGYEFAAHFNEIAHKPFLEMTLETATAGSIGPVDTTGVEGTATFTFSGAPLQRAKLAVRAVTGGTVEVPGIKLQYSLDGELSWSRLILLGEADSYVIRELGVTVTLGAGDVEDGDIARAACIPPKHDSTSLLNAAEALRAYGDVPRLILLVGDISAAAQLQDVIDLVDGLETEGNRHTRIICQLREKLPKAVMQGAPADVDFASVGHTITRGTGSWITDGFKVGQTVSVDGSASNDGAVGVLTAVTATVLTFGAGVVTEANVNGATITVTAEESDAAYEQALIDIVGDTEVTKKVSHRVFVRAGTPRRRSPVNAQRRQLPDSWREACDIMRHDIHISSAKVANGASPGWTIATDEGVLETFDARIDDTLLTYRIGIPTTYDRFAGVFTALPITLAEDDTSLLSREPAGFLGDLLCSVGLREITLRLGGEIPVDDATGYPTKQWTNDTQNYVASRLFAAVSDHGEGARSSSAPTFEIDREVNVLEPGAIVDCFIECVPLGTLEKMRLQVRVGLPGGG